MEPNDYAYFRVIGQHDLNVTCGRLRALSVKGAGWCRIPAQGREGVFPAFCVRLPRGSVDAFRADALSWNELPARGPEDQPPERLTTCWYEVEGYDPKVSYAVIQINHSKGNGDVVFIQPQSFRSRQSAVNWVTQVRVPEVARLMGKDSSDFTYAEATDADYEYSVYMNVKSTKQKVTFDIRRTEVQDDA